MVPDREWLEDFETRPEAFKVIVIFNSTPDDAGGRRVGGVLALFRGPAAIDKD